MYKIDDINFYWNRSTKTYIVGQIPTNNNFKRSPVKWTAQTNYTKLIRSLIGFVLYKGNLPLDLHEELYKKYGGR